MFDEATDEAGVTPRTGDAKRSKCLELAARLSEVRRDLYGEHGAPLLAEALGLPARTWIHYETGVAVPGRILLTFIAMTRVNPLWLLDGSGEKYAAQ